MIKANSVHSSTDRDYINVEIAGNNVTIAKELCAILDELAQNSETKIITFMAIANHITNLQQKN